MIKENEQENTVLYNEKCNFCQSAPFHKILHINARVPLWHMACQKAKCVSNNKEIPNFKLGVFIFWP